MTRLLIHVEGQTEETFVNEVLAPYLHGKGFTLISARLFGNARERAGRGGVRAWSAVRRDIIGHLREDSRCFATIMVDYHAMPALGDREWPGRSRANTMEFAQKATTVETALLEDIRQQLGDSLDSRRFVPYVMIHEFEAMLFSDCERFSAGIGHPELAGPLQNIRDQYETPEHINDSPTTAPSKRIKRLVAGYDKPLMGTLAILEIGLETARAECPHLRAWLERLENLPNRQPPR